jgi:hypothetical protein
MMKVLVTTALALTLATGPGYSHAVVPAVVIWPVVQWVGGFFLFTPTDEILTVGTLTMGARVAGKQAIKQVAKPKGPVVKTGPTAGQVRSRNFDGTWRKKRSDAGLPRGGK